MTIKRCKYNDICLEGKGGGCIDVDCDIAKKYDARELELEAQRARDNYAMYMNDIHLARVLNEGKKKVDITSKLEWKNYK